MKFLIANEGTTLVLVNEGTTLMMIITVIDQIMDFYTENTIMKIHDQIYLIVVIYEMS